MSSEAVYVVGGYMRTGTSMMMRALEAGGMNARYRESRNEMAARFGDKNYVPNRDGLYELERNDYLAFDFPLGFEGCLIKGLNRSVPRMKVMPNGIRVVFMMRDKEEIRQSYMAFFPDRPLQNLENLERNMLDIIERIQNRRDVLGTHVFWYRQVLERPEYHFQLLADAGWPIDSQAAAAIVDPALCRYKLEDLTEGVL